MPLLTVDNLCVSFHLQSGEVRAVDGISFAIEAGETLGIVGESGSGKSVANMALLRLIPMPPGRIEFGSARFNGVDLLQCTNAEIRGIRGKHISMVFQDPMTALNPYMRIGAQVMEPLLVHERCSHADARKRAIATLESVGISDPERRMRAFPHQFSGGMRQRVMIAMALITKPQVLIADEPTTALDVTVQAQILELIKHQQRELGMAVILITHDLGVVAETCDRVAVMYAGRLVETATTEALFERPRHPYTRALLNSLPARRAKGDDLYTIPGMPPDPASAIVGCPFAPRCEHAVDKCRVGRPELLDVAPHHATACVREQAGEL